MQTEKNERRRREEEEREYEERCRGREGWGLHRIDRDFPSLRSPVKPVFRIHLWQPGTVGCGIIDPLTVQPLLVNGSKLQPSAPPGPGPGPSAVPPPGPGSSSVHSLPFFLCGDLSCFHWTWIWLGRKPDTRKPNPKNPSPNPKNPNSKNPNPNSGSNPRYPKLLRVIRVSGHGTRTTRTAVQPKYFCSAQPTKPPLPCILSISNMTRPTSP